MNFEEWYKFGTPEEQGCFMGDAEKGWDACKNEVLKILEKNKRERLSHSFDAGYEYLDFDDTKEDIKKL